MHYTAAHHYDPNRAVFQDFDPFWEFVSGPIHAGTWGPGELDNTFGPKALFQTRLHRGARRKPGAMFRPAVLWPRRDRQRHRGHDGHPEGCRQPGPLVDAHRTDVRTLDQRSGQPPRLATHGSRWRQNRRSIPTHGSPFHLCGRRVDTASGFGGSGETANVSHAFQPSGRCSASNSL